MTDNNGGPQGVMTAGHCSGISKYMQSNGVIYSAPYVRQHMGTRGDIEFHTTTHIEYDDFYVNSSTRWDVTGMVAQTSFSIGQWYSRYGRASGAGSGQVDYLSAGVLWNGTTWLWNLIQTSYSGDVGGDSGGPWYKSDGKAAGIQSGHSTPHPVTFVIDYSYFSTVYHAQIGLNVTLKS